MVNAGELRSAALRTLCRDGHHLTLDLSAVTFIDLSGLASLLAVNRRAATLGGSLRLKDPSRPVTRLLELTHGRVRDRTQQLTCSLAVLSGRASRAS